MSDDQINIEVDGKSVKAKKGQMIIEATDEHVGRMCQILLSLKIKHCG